MEEVFNPTNDASAAPPPELRHNDQSRVVLLFQRLQRVVRIGLGLPVLILGVLERLHRRKRKKFEYALWSLQLIVLLSGVVMGACHMKQCPKLEILPHFTCATGCSGIVFLAFPFYEIYESSSLKGWGRRSMIAVLVLFALEFIAAILYFVIASSKAESEECNRLFYYFCFIFYGRTLKIICIGFLKIFGLPSCLRQLVPRNDIELEVRES